MIDEGTSVAKGWPYADMRRGGGEPKSAMLCVLEMTCGGKRLGFEYSSIIRFDRGGESIAEVVKLATSGCISVDRCTIESKGYRRSRLSLYNDGFDYIVFALGESMSNLEFTRDRQFSRVRGATGMFHDPTWLDARTAWFTANNRRSGIHEFNIHLEIVDDEGPGRIPIIIDPDIGHPGGSGRPKPV